jgi:glycopeptide antibiotics resistance protein
LFALILIFSFIILHAMLPLQVSWGIGQPYFPKMMWSPFQKWGTFQDYSAIITATIKIPCQCADHSSRQGPPLQPC